MKATAKAMDVDQDNDGPPVAAAAEGGGRVSLELKMYRASREGSPDLLQQLINEKRAGITPEACEVYEDKPHDEDYFVNIFPGWTCLHVAAFNGHAECIKILLREGIDRIDTRAADGSTPLMVACGGLPNADCIKLLSEPDQDFDLDNEHYVTALQIALAWKPTLEIVRLLFDKGADLCLEEHSYTLLFRQEHRRQILECPDNGQDRNLKSDEQMEIVKIAHYLANRGFVSGALDSLMHCSESVIKLPLLLDVIMDIFLQNGAVFNDIQIEFVHCVCKLRPLAVCLLAKKSILHLEEKSPMAILYPPPMPMSMEDELEPAFNDVWNAITVMLLQGKIYGTVDLKIVNEIHTILRNRINLPDKFLPLDTLHEMARKAPSLKQIARREIRRRLALSRENIRRLEVEFVLPRELIDYVQADDLGMEVDAIMVHMLDASW